MKPAEIKKLIEERNKLEEKSVKLKKELEETTDKIATITIKLHLARRP